MVRPGTALYGRSKRPKPNLACPVTSSTQHWLDYERPAGRNKAWIAQDGIFGSDRKVGTRSVKEILEAVDNGGKTSEKPVATEKLPQYLPDQRHLAHGGVAGRAGGAQEIGPRGHGPPGSVGPVPDGAADFSGR
jgi:hypothetical protein